jgi:hypothetical protein
MGTGSTTVQTAAGTRQTSAAVKSQNDAARREFMSVVLDWMVLLHVPSRLALKASNITSSARMYASATAHSWRQCSSS